MQMKLIAVLMLLCGLAGAQQAQKPLDGEPWDFGVWAGGGLSVPNTEVPRFAIERLLRLLCASQATQQHQHGNQLHLHFLLGVFLLNPERLSGQTQKRKGDRKGPPHL